MNRWPIPSAPSLKLYAFALLPFCLVHTLLGQSLPATMPGAPALMLPPRTPNPAEPRLMTEDQITEMLRTGADALLKCKTGGTWDREDVSPQFRGGRTALALYALLTVGKGLDDPRLQPNSSELAGPIAWLTDLTPEGTYVAGLQANVMGLLPKNAATKKAMLRAQQLIEHNIQADGSYSYSLSDLTKKPQPSPGDNSNTQFAVLGMWAAQNWGEPVPHDFWITEERYWKAQQCADGSWAYRGNTDTPRFAMTAAAIASLTLAEDYTWTPATVRPPDATAIERGLAAVANKFDPEHCEVYGLYALERVGLAAGLKRIGPHDWYQQGAKWLSACQQGDGLWHLPVLDVNEGSVSTSFALLFLSRGRNPVAFNKLQYDGEWNAHPRNDAHLADWMTSQFERPTNWQVVNAQVPAEDWMDAPVLLIDGATDPHLTADQLIRLRDFIHLGGLVLSVTHDHSAEFDAAIRQAAATVMAGEFTFRNLPADHPVFKTHATISPAPTLLGINNGLREVWIHCPDDYSSAWQQRHFEHKLPWELAANIFFYANGKTTLKTKMNLAVPPSPERANRLMTVGRLAYAGSWDPEPGAWLRMARLAQAHFHTQLDVHPVDFDHLDPRESRVVYLTGLDALQLQPEQIAQLRRYLAAGGTLWGEAIGGNAAFGDSFAALAKKLCPESPMDMLPPNHPLFLGQYADGVDMSTVAYRSFTNLREGRLTTPRLGAVSKNGRLVILFSNYDMASGFLGTNTWGINGYTPASAQGLARDILLYLRTDVGVARPATSSAPATMK